MVGLKKKKKKKNTCLRQVASTAIGDMQRVCTLKPLPPPPGHSGWCPGGELSAMVSRREGQGASWLPPWHPLSSVQLWCGAGKKQEQELGIVYSYHVTLPARDHPAWTSFSTLWSIHVLAAAAAKSLQSCPTLCDPIDSSPPGSLVPGILQARTLEWVAISFSNA